MYSINMYTDNRHVLADNRHVLGTQHLDAAYWNYNSRIPGKFINSNMSLTLKVREVSQGNTNNQHL